MGLSIVGGGVDRARIDWIGSPVWSRVVEELMHMLAEELFDTISKHGSRAGIDKGGIAIQINAVNAFSGLRQNEHVLTLKLFEDLCRFFPLGNVADNPAVVATARCFPGRQRQFDRKFFAVLSKTV